MRAPDRWRAEKGGGGDGSSSAACPVLPGPAKTAALPCRVDALALSAPSLARLMPMYLWLDQNGAILGAGPTLAKILGTHDLAGRNFFDSFKVKNPRGITGIDALAANAGVRLQLNLRGGARTAFRGLVVPVACGAGVLVNLSFGITVGQGVRDHGLTDADFAPTDLAVELLYLTEAKALVMDELRDLNSRLEAARRQAEADALTDTLTGLANRRAFDLAFAMLIRGGHSFGLMHVDLDYFKQVNDNLGHAAGDHVLRRVARRLHGEIREADTLARLGGDEFALLFPGLSDPDLLAGIADRIVARLDQPIDYAGQPCRISASVGISISDDYSAPTAARMLDDADAALYASKKAGRGRWTLSRTSGS